MCEVCPVVPLLRLAVRVLPTQCAAGLLGLLPARPEEVRAPITTVMIRIASLAAWQALLLYLNYPCESLRAAVNLIL